MVVVVVGERQKYLETAGWNRRQRLSVEAAAAPPGGGGDGPRRWRRPWVQAAAAPWVEETVAARVEERRGGEGRGGASECNARPMCLYGPLCH
jgi:hypothetical protein